MRSASKWSPSWRRGTPRTSSNRASRSRYIEAVKKYPPGLDDLGCGLETFVSGWVHINTRQPKPKTELTARVTYCDRKGVSYMLPLGMLKVRGRTHWVFQTSSWESEWYSVVEMTPGRIRYVAEYFAGGRPTPF